MHVFSLSSNRFSWSSLLSSSGSVIDSGSHLEKALIHVITMFDSRGVRKQGRPDGLVGDQSHLKCFTNNKRTAKWLSINGDLCTEPKPISRPTPFSIKKCQK